MRALSAMMTRPPAIISILALILISGLIGNARLIHPYLALVAERTAATTDAPEHSDATAPKPKHDSVRGWTSPHLADCGEMTGAGEPDDGIFVRTRTDPPFAMNIHNPKVDEVSRVIRDAGCWECGYLWDMLGALSAYDGSYFLDIGGNIGMWSLTAAAANHRTFTIEALPGNCKRFCRSVDKNSFHNRTHLLNIAATSEPETFRLSVPRGNIGGTSVIAMGNDTNLMNNKVVRGVPIDTLGLPTDRPVVMKLDVEGHELQALIGATNFLQDANVVFVMMELRTFLLKDRRYKGIFDILVSKGLTPFRLNYGYYPKYFSESETKLDVNQLDKWRHFKHPKVKYFDVAWKREDFLLTGNNVTGAVP